MANPCINWPARVLKSNEKKRVVDIFSLALVSFTEETITLTVHCSKGTYVRTLIEDIGEVLGCGAYVIELRRTAVGTYDDANMLTLEELENLHFDGGFEAVDDKILSIGTAVADWPEVNVSEAAAFYLKQGQAIIVPDAPTEGRVRLLIGERFLGIGEIAEDGKVKPKKLITQ